MIGLWIAVALLAALVSGLLLWPLRSRAPLASRLDHEVQIYRDQLAEVARDRQRGLLTEAEADSARLEIERRILSRAESEGAATGAATAAARLANWGLAAVVPIAAVVFYLYLGSPGEPDRPFAERPAPPAPTQTAEHGGDMEAMVERLAQRMRQFPLDIDGWILLARSYMTLKRYEEAASALAPAVEYSDRRPDILSAYAEARVMAGGGAVSDEVVGILDEILARTPAEPRAWFYIGLARAQRNDPGGAAQVWTDLLAISPPNAPWLDDISNRIREAAGDAGLDPKTLAPSDRARAIAAAIEREAPQQASREAPRGPTREDMENAERMSPEDRQAMIRGMIEGLAARLEENPDDLEGWIRLERSYRVLGETEKADEAKRRIQASSAAAAPAPQPVQVRGPTREDVEAARGMSSGDQATMIRGMVEGLAARLKENPNDLEGWLMLARSYEVLGEPDKAKDARAKAEALKRGTVP